MLFGHRRFREYNTVDKLFECVYHFKYKLYYTFAILCEHRKVQMKKLLVGGLAAISAAMIAMPTAALAQPAPDYDDVLVRVNVGAALYISCNQSPSLISLNGGSGQVGQATGMPSGQGAACLIETNNQAGYQVTMATKTTDTGLNCSTPATCGTDSIPSQATQPTAGTPGWATSYTPYTAANTPGAATWAAVPPSNAAGLMVAWKDSGSASGGDMTQSVDFGVAIDATVKPGHYDNTVTFTAVAL